MSYILEALKDAEQSRKRGDPPDLASVHRLEPAAGPPRWKQPALLAGTVVGGIVLGLALAWLGRSWLIGEPVPPKPRDIRLEAINVPPMRKEIPETVAPASEPPMSPSAESTLAGGTQTASAVAESEPVAGVSEAVSQPPPIQSETPETVAHAKPAPRRPVVDTQAAQPPTEPASVSSAPEPESARQPEPAPQPAEPREPAFPHLRQLPLEVQEAIPKLVITVHLYAEQPGQRLVRVNGRTLREGGSLGENLVLEAITPTGTVFQYGEHRFRVRAL